MRRLYTYYIYMLLAALGLPGCELIHDDDMDCQLYTPEGVPYAYVSIALSTAMTPSTRATDDPTGGEDGDGREPGQSEENKVNDITLFFYDVADAPDGVNSTAEAETGTTATPIPIVARLHLEGSQLKGTATQKTTEEIAVEQLLVGHSYHVLAVVNGGETFDNDTYSTLDALRDATVTRLYDVTGTSDGATYSNFLMSSERDEWPALTIYSSNSETDPARTEIWVERVTARVDYKVEDSYEVKTNGGNIIGTARITGAMLVNTLNSNAECWLLKRVASMWGSTDVEYLGDETVDAGTASNYVIDAKADKEESDFVAETYFPHIGYDNLTWESLFIEGSLIESLEDNYLCVGYPKENVNQTGQRDRTTGIVFRAVYTPNEMTEGATFFEWDGMVYPSLEKLMEKKFESSWTIINDGWNDVITWENLRANIISKLDNDPVGYLSYLRQYSADKIGTISTDEMNELKWAYYLETVCYYKNGNDGVTVDINDVDDGTTRRILHEISGLSTYKKGICYYTYWIKHANDLDPNNDLVSGKDNTGGVMEYAIVRNNVYKLDIKSVSTPGNDIPGERTVNINVLVEDWQLIKPGESVDLEPVKEGGA